MFTFIELTNYLRCHHDFLVSVELLRKGTDPGDPYSYTISDVDTEDTGLYSCVAGNILGETVHVAHLQVGGACCQLTHQTQTEHKILTLIFLFYQNNNAI